MKSISILIYSLASGGAERQVSYMVNSLYKHYDITLVLMNDTIHYKIPQSLKIVYLEKSDPFESGIKKLLKLPLLGWKYKRFCKKNGIDVSLSFMTRPNYINAFAKLFGNRAKTIISERSMFSLQYSYNNLQSFINKKLVHLYKLADKVIANSQGNSQDLLKYGIKSDVIYNMIDLEAIQNLKKESLDLKKEGFTFVTIGRLDKGKNHKLLLEALKELDAKLWIIGDGELREDLGLKVKELGIEGKVNFLGKQKNPYKFLAKADSFVFASNHEGFPNVLLEALACKLPIVSTDCKSGPREILAPATKYIDLNDIELAEYGILTPVGDIENMKKAMELMIKDSALRNNYHTKALKRAKEFDKDIILKRWIETL